MLAVLRQRTVRAMSTASNQIGPTEASIRDKLTAVLDPKELVITNDSWKHANHAEMKVSGGGNGETHFAVQVISDVFAGKSTMQRHSLIYAALREELGAGVHALSLATKTSSEAEKAASRG